MTRLQLAVLLSIAVHAVILFGIKFVFPSSLLRNSVPLQVVLVNSKSARPSPHPEVLAQTNLDGGGNTDADRHLSSPLPPTPDRQDVEPEPVPPTPPAPEPQPKPEPKPKPVVKKVQHTADADKQQEQVKQLEQEARKLVTRLKSKHHVATAEEASPPAPQKSKLHHANIPPASDLLARSVAIARLQARIDKEWDDYQKRPRKRFIGARAKEYRFARYVEDWRLKMERIGTLNYPQAARRDKIYGSLQLTVEIRSDGSLVSVHIDRSSGYKVLDDAAIRIVHLAAPFAPFPPNIAKDTDILGITRIWTFTPSNRLASQ